MIHEEVFEVNEDQSCYNHIGKLFMQKAIKLEPDRWYSIGKILVLFDSSYSTFIGLSELLRGEREGRNCRVLL